MRDSETGVQRMAVGRHINDRGHVMTREHNVRTGDQEQNEELINLDEGWCLISDHIYPMKIHQIKL